MDYITEAGRQDKVDRRRPEQCPIQIPTVAEPAKGQEHWGSCAGVTKSLPDALEF